MFRIVAVANSIKIRNAVLLPPFVPTKSIPFNKGLRLMINPFVATYTVSYVPDVNMELFAVSYAATGYQDSDYWELTTGGVKYVETNYTKEVAELVKMGVGTLVVPVPAGQAISFSFRNDSGTNKIVWPTLRLLK